MPSFDPFILGDAARFFRIIASKSHTLSQSFETFGELAASCSPAYPTAGDFNDSKPRLTFVSRVQPCCRQGRQNDLFRDCLSRSIQFGA